MSKAYDEALRRIENCRREGERSAKLDLSGLGLTAIPPEIGQLRSLTELRLYKNQLTTLPPEIGQLTALKEFSAARNQLKDLPDFFGAFPVLRKLWLDRNQIEELPQSISQLAKLEELWLYRNELRKLPERFGDLTNLVRLDLRENRLEQLPASFGNLRSIELLWLWGNHLRTLPDTVSGLTLLKELYLEDNKLDDLPRALRELKELRRFFLHGNKQLQVPPETLGPTRDEVGRSGATPASPQAILDFFFARQEQGGRPLQEVRLFLVGRGRVGKTSLLKVLRGEQPDTHEPETPGITVLPLELKCARGSAVARVWDFGGQDFLHGTHRIFLSERCVYVLVLEGRESNWELETDYWLRFIQSYGGDSPVLVALNKYDTHAFSVDRFRLRERCPQIKFVETDAFTPRGINELRELLEQTVNGMEDVWKDVPLKWHWIKEALKDMPESFLDYQSYRKLCESHGVIDEQPQASLAEMLHRLGIALNFREHYRLRETSVLKPKWVTEGIYGLLRFAQRKDCHGVLERAWIGEVLPAKEYPAQMHDFVMELMEKFEVAFALETPDPATGQPTAPQRWLIPELLPEAQPAAFAEFRAAGVKRLRFTYPQALPSGLLPRLIVRTHEMSEMHPQWRWRSGVVLEWNDAQALVRLDRHERCTEVAVRGAADADRQSLFDIIRAHLTVLHDKVPVVEEVQALDDPEKWVPMTDLRVAEQEQEPTLPVTVGTGAEAKRVKLPVVATLDAVESREARVAQSPSAPARMRLFVSYAHADEKKIKPLSTHLTILDRWGYIQPWSDRELVAGEEWEAEIFAKLAQADIVLLIYSTASQASDFIQTKEVPRALERWAKQGCTLIVVPLDLDRRDWNDTIELERELMRLQTATWNAKPVLKFTPHREGWKEVERAIRKVVETRRTASQEGIVNLGFP